MIDLYKLIETKLKEVTSSVFFDIADEGAKFPYVTYDLPNSNIDGFREDFFMYVDIWHDSDHIIELENIVTEIEKKLKRFKYIDKNMQVSIYQTNRLKINTEREKEIQRRQLKFICKVYN